MRLRRDREVTFLGPGARFEHGATSLLRIYDVKPHAPARVTSWELVPGVVGDFDFENCYPIANGSFGFDAASTGQQSAGGISVQRAEQLRVGAGKECRRNGVRGSVGGNHPPGGRCAMYCGTGSPRVSLNSGI
jgi:hypothetical protein